MEYLEFTGTEDPFALRRTWGKSSLVKIKDFILQDPTLELISLVNHCYDLLKAHSDDASIDPDLLDNFKKWDGIWVKALPKFLATYRPDLVVVLSGLLDGITQRFNAIFELNWKINTAYSFFRRHYTFDPNKYVRWHTDAEAARTRNVNAESVNIWMPLDMVGEKLPSLEFIPFSSARMRNEPLPESAGPYTYRDDEWVQGRFKDTDIWTPQAEPGDAVIFDHYTLHRTQRIAPSGGHRTNCEFRFFPA